MNDYSEAFNKLGAYAYLGEKVLSNGTRLIGKAPHIAPLAWLHSIYPGLSEAEVLNLESLLKVVIPNSFKDFLRTTNGLNVFNTTLSLYGLRRNYKRTDTEVWQPFDAVVPNTLEKPPNAPKNALIIGSYDWDGSYLCLNGDNERVYLYERENSTPLYEWKSFSEMLKTEIKRLIVLFDEQGRELQPDHSTLPMDNPS